MLNKPKSAITLIRGEDRVLILRIVTEDTEEPYDLTDYTFIAAFFKKQTGNTLHQERTPADAILASTVFQGVTYTAATAGILGNAISLVFDGVKTIADCVSAWNTAHPTNVVTHTDPSPTTAIPTAGTAQLSGGVDAISGNIHVTNLVLGKLEIVLSDSVTDTLKTGQGQDFELQIDKGASRRIVKFRNALNVLNREIN